MKRIRVVKVEERILELLPQGWLNAKTGRTYKTAMGAWRALQREAKRIAEANPEIIYMQHIEWHPKTIAGSAMVRVISNDFKPNMGDN